MRTCGEYGSRNTHKEKYRKENVRTDDNCLSVCPNCSIMNNNHSGSNNIPRTAYTKEENGKP